MSHRWLRERPFVLPYGEPVIERWRYENGNEARRHEPEVIYGKPFDPIALKQDIRQTFRRKVETVAESRTRLYGGAEFQHVDYCPICESPSASAEQELVVYGAAYVRCGECEHRYVLRRPTSESLATFYTESSDYSSTYTDPAAAALRVREVAQPKADWAFRQFRRRHGRNPRVVLDVGAGGGHFVAACRDLGAKAAGLELSESSRAFAQSMFGISLEPRLFDPSYEPKDLPEMITFWGLIEHVPEPMALLRQARRLLARTGGLTIASAPNWASLSTAAQKANPERIVRHLDPLGHIHVFTDSSLATAFELSDHEISSAWYFGMDAYEYTLQVLNSANTDLSNFDHLRPMIRNAQEIVDIGGVSDSMVIAGFAAATA